MVSSTVSTTPPERTPPSRRRRWWILPILLVLGWLVLGVVGGPFLGRLNDVQRNDDASFLPADSEATRVVELQKRFSASDVRPAVVVFERPAGLTPRDREAIRQRVEALNGVDGLEGSVSPPVVSEDGQAARVLVPVSGADPFAAGRIGQEVSTVASRELPAGLEANVTGPAGYGAQMAEVFSGIDGKLLVVTAALVALILVVVYRSPLLPLIVLVGAGLALALASMVVYPLAKHEVVNLNGQTQGILLILVFGAGTDYALLLVSRYREELTRHGTARAAMRRALRASLEPIAASAGTVIAGMLCMLFSDLASNRGLGPIAAIGIAAALLASLTFLPATLVLFGRSAFWPFRPDQHAEPDGTDEPSRPVTLWHRVAGAVGRRPRRTWIVTAAVLLVAAAFVPQLHADGVSQRDTFLGEVEAVVGQRALDEHFPDSGGAGMPAVVIADADHVRQVVDAAEGVEGVEEAIPKPVSPRRPGQPKVVDGMVEVNATLRDPADSEAAVDTVRRLREAVHAVPGAEAEVGGQTANQLEVRQTAVHDRSVIIPLVLAVIFVLLVLLLRAVVAPLLLIGTVVLSFAATLGVGGLVFEHLLGFPGADPSVPLYAFVFLVALGIDYNIFLMTRVREESLRSGTEEGTLRGLAVTGGVITSAGVVLAATFAALGVLPVLFMVQIAILVAFGVLLDTLVVRSLLVPALIVDIGRRVWWPSRLGR
ncbi:MMPL family transporter [Actinopolyspora mortivallis]|uniref:Membrane transport protein MMPL domain-containing protein n=1 Tax=Actinopolyspora mortivallis TaxID=33906 RepID=A0A2T0GV06_ACTMO|nr:MMPL family transporter [Actinopolyspora mortivallis]PRW62945.1 hypothetical protein CEP50_12800 [Actinopolyspora mortivallis]